MHLLTCQTIDLRPRQPSSQKDKPHPSGILLDFSLTSSLFYKVNHSSEFLRLQVCPSEPFYCNCYERLLSSLGVNHGGFFSFYEWAPLFVPNSQCSVSFGGQSPSWVQGLPLADCLATTWPLERFPCLLLFQLKRKIKTLHSFIHHHPECPVFSASHVLFTMFNKLGRFAGDQKSLSPDIVHQHLSP